MNEFNKLLTSVVLLGAGFFAASLVGPPEVIDRLARYLRPEQPAADGLRPIASNAAPATADAWPGLDTAGPTAEPAPMNVAPVAAMVAPSSWGSEPAPAAPESQPDRPTSPWGGAGPAAFSTPPSSDDWLTGASLATSAPREEPSAGPRPLTPVPRGGASATPPSAAPSPAPNEPTEPGWPELRAPMGPASASLYGTAPSQEVTAAKPSLDSAPYGARPRFDDSASAFETDANPLRYDASARQTFDPIERAPVEDAYVKHVVTDGDTLPLLAERYLGDSSRAAELYELNRDRLEQPDLLPIGMVLRAPHERSARKPAPTATTGYPRLERAGDFATVSATEAYLPPLAAAPRRPLTAVGAGDERPLTREERLGPVDAVYNQDVAWDANRW